MNRLIAMTAPSLKSSLQKWDNFGYKSFEPGLASRPPPPLVSGDVYVFRPGLTFYTEINMSDKLCYSCERNHIKYSDGLCEDCHQIAIGISFELAFIEKAASLLKKFDYQDALALSDALHKAEAKGYKMSATMDRLWAKLTDKIEIIREREVMPSGLRLQ